jgi:hypothetical protein
VVRFSTGVDTQNQEKAFARASFGSPKPYRYGDSNPGFRTENWLWKAN